MKRLKDVGRQFGIYEVTKTKMRTAMHNSQSVWLSLTMTTMATSSRSPKGFKHTLLKSWDICLTGFRLFSTSVLGQAAEDTPAPVRRRPVPSSSDSDSEMETRLREAAVSLKDLFHTSSLPSTLSTPSAELPCSEKVKKKTKVAEEEENHIKKKKKKRKSNQKSEQVDSESSPLNAQRNGEHRTSEQDHTQVKVKRKKKKKRELHTEEEALT
ncbi:protein CUSTOS isoform X3 [Etheostoma spectabile]|uniref:protein CUSTOS isoform X3 n=1 Tax=Etheostoma spectabile TaxID=54343 RepID=UPI0013AFB851|nr:protein CUSTOS isoform X3 [Etheostoma spectabile]